MKNRKDIRSSVIDVDMSKVEVTDDGTMIKGLAIMGNKAVNTDGKVVRVFTSEALDSAVRVFEGALARIDHDRTAVQSRGVQSGFGVYSNIRKEGNTLYGDVTLWDCPDAIKVKSIAQRTPRAVGNSIHAAAKFYIDDNGIEIVEEIMPRTIQGYKPSVDLVEDPAATTNLFEDKEHTNVETEEMEYKDLTLESVKANRPDLYEKILTQGKESRNDEVKALTQDKDTLQKTVDDYKVKEQVLERERTVNKLIKESGLPEHAVTDTFRKHCMNLSESKEKSFEDAVKEVIEDRKLVVNPGGVHDNPAKDFKQDKTSGGDSDIAGVSDQLRQVLLNNR